MWTDIENIGFEDSAAYVFLLLLLFQRLAQLDGAEVVSRAENKGNRPDNLRQLDDACSAPSTLKLKVGAQVSREPSCGVYCCCFLLWLSSSQLNDARVGRVTDVPSMRGIKKAEQAKCLVVIGGANEKRRKREPKRLTVYVQAVHIACPTPNN